MTTTEQDPRQQAHLELLAIVVEAAAAARYASPQLVQRKVRTGWEESKEILAELEAAGVVGPADADERRPVLVAPDGVESALERLRDRRVESAVEEVESGPLDAPPPLVESATPPVESTPSEVESIGGAQLVKRHLHAVESIQDAEVVPDRSGVHGRQHVIGRIRHAPATVEATRRVVKVVRSKPVGVVGLVLRSTAKVVVVTAQGGASGAKRLYGQATHAHLREQVHIARMTGEKVRATELEAQLDKALTDRQKRILAWPAQAWAMLQATGVLLGGVVALVLLGGVVAWLMPGGIGWVEWWGGVGGLLGLAAGLAKVVGWLLAWGGAPLLAWLAWREGQRAGEVPAWLLTKQERKLADSEITPSKVVVAIRDMGITELRKAVKEAPDAGAGLLGPIAVVGEGVEGDILLPSGVSTDQFLARRRRFAENLVRHEYEVHLSIPERRTIRFWAANPGALDKPIGASPLVTNLTPKANTRNGRAPLGEDLRSRPVAVATHQRHVTITGISNHGKTAILRGVALWEAFDVVTEFRVADLKGYGDWAMFGPIEGRPGLATCYISGPTDEHVIAATEMVEEGVREMNRRLQLPPQDWPKLTLVVDEAQKAYMCPVKDDEGNPYGGKSNRSRFFMAVREIHNQGRAVNVVLWQGTQDPTDDNFPKIVREGAHVRMSLVVGTESQSKMALGEAAVDGGAAPHLLRQDIDKGVVVMHGGVELPRGETSITVRTHFIDTDAAWTVARRALERRRKAGVVSREVTGGPARTVDHLVNIHAAMRGEKRPRTVVILGRLIEDDAATYEPWGHDDLSNAVRKYAHFGVGIRKYGGDSVLRLEEVENALALRE